MTDDEAKIVRSLLCIYKEYVSEVDPDNLYEINDLPIYRPQKIKIFAQEFEILKKYNENSIFDIDDESQKSKIFGIK